MMKKRVRILGVFGVISLLSYTAMVVFSLASLVLIAAGAKKEQIRSLCVWAACQDITLTSISQAEFDAVRDH